AFHIISVFLILRHRFSYFTISCHRAKIWLDLSRARDVPAIGSTTEGEVNESLHHRRRDGGAASGGGRVGFRGGLVPHFGRGLGSAVRHGEPANHGRLCPARKGVQALGNLRVLPPHEGRLLAGS